MVSYEAPYSFQSTANLREGMSARDENADSSMLRRLTAVSSQSLKRMTGDCPIEATMTELSIWMHVPSKHRDVSVQTSESSWGGKKRTLSRARRSGYTSSLSVDWTIYGPSSRQATEAIRFGKGAVDGSYVSSGVSFRFSRPSAFLDTFGTGAGISDVHGISNPLMAIRGGFRPSSSLGPLMFLLAAPSG